MLYIPTFFIKKSKKKIPLKFLRHAANLRFFVIETYAFPYKDNLVSTSELCKYSD